MENNVLLTGATGFIGGAIEKKVHCDLFNQDIRDFNPEKRYRYVLHFASPSSQVLFSRNPQYCIDSTINGFINVLDYCKRSGAKLIYPSTGHISYDNEYAKCKSLCESMALNSGVETLGIRIFAGYGPGEEHKRDYKSPIGLFLDDVVSDRQPIIYGDGNQLRDFVYIDDIVDTILFLASRENGISEIGTGISTSFNDVIKIIQSIIGKTINPIYVDKPKNYVEETRCNNPIKNPTTIENGIQKYYESYCNDHHQ